MSNGSSKVVNGARERGAKHGRATALAMCIADLVDAKANPDAWLDVAIEAAIWEGYEGPTSDDANQYVDGFADEAERATREKCALEGIS